MINRDPKCVFVAANAAEAAVVANWLEHQGVPAQVMDTMTLDGLTAWAGVSARGIEVWALHKTSSIAPGNAVAGGSGLLPIRLIMSGIAGSQRLPDCGNLAEKLRELLAPGYSHTTFST